MLKEQVKIKQIPDGSAELVGLEKHNRSKMPSTRDVLSVAQGMDGRYVTGIDEDSFEINSILDDEEREAVAEETKKLRERLQKLTGKDLSGTSSFWEDYTMTISSDQDKILVRSNPHDVIMYNALVANGYIAPSIEEAALPKYRFAKYYAFSQEASNKEEVSTQKKRDRARSKLYEISEDKDRMVLLGQFLEGPRFSEKLSMNDAYQMLSNYINSKESENINKFIKASEKPVEELVFKITIDKALRKKIIKFQSGYYQRGNVTLGKNIEQVVDNLKSPEFANEFLSIKQELDGDL